MNAPSKDTIIALLRAWINQRPGLDPRNYISGWNDADGRAAACAVLAAALWDYHRPDYDNTDRPGDAMRAMFRRNFGRKLANRWLD